MNRILLFCTSLALAIVGVTAAASINADGAVPRPGAAACSGTIAITELRFVPPSVTRGGTSTAHVVAHNCTGRTQSTELTWLGQFKGKHISGCPAIDPLPESATFTSRGTVKAKLSYELPTSCTASQLQVTTRFTGSGGTQLAVRSAALSITA